MKRNVPLLLGFLLLAPGCDNGQVALDNLCQETQKALCDVMRRCEIEWMFKLIAHQTCEDMFTCDDFEFEELSVSVDAGRVLYDPEAASKCLRTVRTSDCTNIAIVFEDDPPPECNQIFIGQVASGGDCYRDEECTEGHWCDAYAENCPGTCQAYLALGGDCSGAGRCDYDVADCAQGVCVALAAEGESCEDLGCGPGLDCDNDADPRVCVKPGVEGDTCSANDECRGLLFCQDGKCRGPATQGQACEVGEDFDTYAFACETGLYCDVDIAAQETEGTCQPRKGAGSECLTFYECQPGLVCLDVIIAEPSVTPGSCGQPQGEGQECPTEIPFPVCDYTLYCDEASGTCKAFPGEGDACVYGEDPDCLPDLYCDSLQPGEAGTCRAPKANGADCTSYEECISTNCQDGKCHADETCSP